MRMASSNSKLANPNSNSNSTSISTSTSASNSTAASTSTFQSTNDYYSATDRSDPSRSFPPPISVDDGLSPAETSTFKPSSSKLLQSPTTSSTSTSASTSSSFFYSNSLTPPDSFSKRNIKGKGSSRSRSSSRSPSRIFTSLPQASTNSELPFSPTHFSPITENAPQASFISFGRTSGGGNGMEGGLDGTLSSPETHEWLKKKSSSRGLGQVFEQALNLDKIAFGSGKGDDGRSSSNQAISVFRDEALPSSSDGFDSTFRSKPRLRPPSQPILGIQTSLPRSSSGISSGISSQPSGVSSSVLDPISPSPSTSGLPSAYPASSLYSAITSGVSAPHSKFGDGEMEGYNFDDSRPKSVMSMGSETSWETGPETSAGHRRSGSTEKVGFQSVIQDPEKERADENGMEVMMEDEAEVQSPSLRRSCSDRSRDQVLGIPVFSTNPEFSSTFNLLHSNPSIDQSAAPSTPTSSLPPLPPWESPSSLDPHRLVPSSSTSLSARTVGTQSKKTLHDLATPIFAEDVFTRLNKEASKQSAFEKPDLDPSDQREHVFQSSDYAKPSNHSLTLTRPSVNSSSSISSSFSQSNLPLLILDFRSKDSFSKKRIKGSINLTVKATATSTISNSNQSQFQLQNSASTSSSNDSSLLLTFNSSMSKRRFSDLLGNAFGSSRSGRGSNSNGGDGSQRLGSEFGLGENLQTREKRFLASRSPSGTLVQGRGLEQLEDSRQEEVVNQQQKAEEPREQSSQSRLISDQPPTLPPLWHTRSDILLLFDPATPSPSSPNSEFGGSSKAQSTSAAPAVESSSQTTSENSCSSSVQSTSSIESNSMSLGVLPRYGSEFGASTNTSPATSPGNTSLSIETAATTSSFSDSQNLAWEMARHIRENLGGSEGAKIDGEEESGDGNLYFMSTNFLDSRKMEEVRESSWLVGGADGWTSMDGGQDSNSSEIPNLRTSLLSPRTSTPGSSLESTPNLAADFSFSGLTIASASLSAFGETCETSGEKPADHHEQRRESDSTVHAPSPRSATATSSPPQNPTQVSGPNQSPLRGELNGVSSVSDINGSRAPSPHSSSTRPGSSSLLLPTAPSPRIAARPGRPSLARLDTSERVKTLRSLQAAVPPVGRSEEPRGTRRSAVGPPLSLNTSIQRQPAMRSATLGPPDTLGSAASSHLGRTPSLGLVIDNGRAIGSRPSSRASSEEHNASTLQSSTSRSTYEASPSVDGRANPPLESFHRSHLQPLRAADPESNWNQDLSLGISDPTIPHANGPRSASASEAGLGPYPGSEAWFLQGARSLGGASLVEAGPTTAIPTTGGSHSEFSRHFSSPSTPLSISEILPNFLYLGPDITSVQHVRSLQAQGVKRILNMALEIDPETALLDAKSAEDRDVKLVEEFDKYHRVPMRDNVEEKGVQKGLLEVCGYLDDARLHSAPVYVHCKAGKSRSVTAVMAYLIHAYRWSLSRAYAFVAERREVVSPNIGFVAELMTFEQRERTLSMVSSGRIQEGTDQDENENEADEEKGKKPERDRRIRDSLPVGMASSTSTKSEDLLSASQKHPNSAAAPSLEHPSASLEILQPPSLLPATPSIAQPSHSSSATPMQLPGISNKPEAEETEAEFEIETRGADGRYRTKVPPFQLNLLTSRRATLAGVDSSNNFTSSNDSSVRKQ